MPFYVLYNCAQHALMCLERCGCVLWMYVKQSAGSVISGKHDIVPVQCTTAIDSLWHKTQRNCGIQLCCIARNRFKHQQPVTLWLVYNHLNSTVALVHAFTISSTSSAAAEPVIMILWQINAHVPQICNQLFCLCCQLHVQAVSVRLAAAVALCPVTVTIVTVTLNATGVVGALVCPS